MGGKFVSRALDQSAEQQRHQQDTDSCYFWDFTVTDVPTGHRC